MNTLITTNPAKNTLASAPPFLMMAGLLLWGWQTNYLIYAFFMGILLELPAFIKWRIDFSDKDVNQVADLSGILFFVVIVYIFFNYSFYGIFKILGLLPFSLYLIMLTQRFSVSNSIKTSALLISVRRLGKNAGKDVLYDVDISIPYLFVCLISASVGYKYSDIFFISSTSLIIWLLWSIRPKHYAIYKWLSLIIIVIGLSYSTQFGLKKLQESAETFFMNMYEQYGWKSRDPERTMTAIGSLGRLKMSDRIVFRVKSDHPLKTPLYFQETAYSIYEYGTWRNPNVEFDIVEKTPNKNEWRINPDNNDTGNIEVGLFLDDQSAIIPAPDNTNTLSGKDLIQLETSIYGAKRIEARKGWVNYRMGYTNKKFIEALPDKNDNTIPNRYRNDLKQIATELDLYSKTPEEILNTVKKYFSDNFYYSITQNQRYTRGGYLSKFLLETKKGHCEYFATATALLLREAGIPTRYVIGFSVQEYSPWQHMYIVRARHAHSWVKYYMNNGWHILDTTPSTWAPQEAKDRTFLEPIMDVLSWFRYTITSNDIDDKPESNNWLIWLLIPLGAYLAWRFYKKERVTNDNKRKTKSSNIEYIGLDSPLYILLNKLEKEADKRLSGETLINWIKRILPDEKAGKYIELINLHYRYRFNPDSDKQQDKENLNTALSDSNF